MSGARDTRDYTALRREFADVLTIVECGDAHTAARAAKRLPDLARQLLDVGPASIASTLAVDCGADGYTLAELPSRLLTSPRHPGRGDLSADWFNVHDEAGHTLLTVKTYGNLHLLHEMVRAYAGRKQPVERERTWDVYFWLSDPTSTRKMGYPRLSCRVKAIDGVHAVNRVKHCYGKIELDEVQLVRGDV